MATCTVAKQIAKKNPQPYLAPDCCTPANVFPRRQIPHVVSALQAFKCRQGFAKDHALDAIKWRHETGAFLIEPNLVEHIGFYSTLRSLGVLRV